MARVACIMMHRDETLLLEPWLRYHGFLFGYENIFILDNGSKNPVVQATLKRFAKVGVNVNYSHPSRLDFDRKGCVVGTLIEHFQQTSRYDIVLPLDCDEFVAVIGDNGISISRNQILDHLSELAQLGPMVKIRHCLENRPGFLELFRLVNFNKTIVPLGDFKSIDHGFHEAKARSTRE